MSSLCYVVVSGGRKILERTKKNSKKSFNHARFCLVNTFFWSPQQFTGRDVSHAWFGLSLWSTRQSLARKSLLRPSHGALSVTESGLRLRAQRYNKVCTPHACAAMSRGGINSNINQLSRAACAVLLIIVRFTSNKLSI